ncbi:helix-turn-helix domain-containing protein [Parafrankia sp. CH37]|nr:helix-turn-helix domain-containing protein [Parafrankia sp. CH37]
MSWADRAADRSPLVQRSRSRSVQQMTVIVDAAKRLIASRGSSFTTQDLVKEAGIAMQTFYRHFPGKDQLMLAVIEDVISGQVVHYQESAAGEPDPLARLRRYMEAALHSLGSEDGAQRGARFITAEHWRLYQLYPDEVDHATRPFADLVAGELEAAQAVGLIGPIDTAQTGELVNLLVRAVFHHYAFATRKESAAEVAARVWAFCLGGFGAVTPPATPLAGKGAE